MSLMHTLMNRRSLIAASGGGLAAALAGCSGSSSTNDNPGGQGAFPEDPEAVEGKISYGFWDANQQTMLEDIIKEFNARYPNIEVQLQLTPWADYWTKLRTQVSSASLPDVFWMNGPNFLAYARTGQLESLKGLQESGNFDPGNYPEALMEMYSVDGEPFAAPKDFDTVAIWYNKELFDKAGIDYPDDSWDLETYKEKAVELRSALKADGIWGCAEVFSRTASYYHSIPTAGGRVISDDKTESGYDMPETIEGVKFWRDLIESGACPDLQQLAETSGYTLFESGRCAMQWSGNWRVPAMLESSVAKDVTVAPLPGGKDRKTAIHGIGNVISAHSKNRDAAQVFVAFLAGEEAARISAESGAANPALNGTQDLYVDAHPEYNLQVFIDQAKENAVPFPISQNTPEWNEVESEFLTKVFTGEVSASDGCTELAAQMNEILAKESQ